MTIYPAIDIKNGRCVRLAQGRADRETVYFENPVEVGQMFKSAGSKWVHVVDLDGAFTGDPVNLPIIQDIAALGLKVEMGGGMRSHAAVQRALDAGVSRVVIGTRAAESEAFVAELVQAFGEKIAVGIDAKDGLVAVKGWVDTTELRAMDFAKRMNGIGVRTIIYTDIGTDGMLTGPNLSAQEMMASVFDGQVIASGGISTLEDVKALAALSRRQPNLHGVIIGKAIYERRLTVEDALSVV